VVGGNLYGRKCERGWERRHYRECYADNHASLVQQVKIRATTASTDTTGALVVSGGANTKCECWWKRILSDIGSSGDANVDGGMNVVGNADISGNVMLTTTSSLVQQVKIRQRRSPQTQTRGVGGVWWGTLRNVNVGEIPLFRVRWVSGDANVDGGMNAVNADICGNVMLTSGTSFVQQVHIRATTASSSSTRGALVVSGGAGTGNVNVGGMLVSLVIWTEW
jgi:hypothetical protein